MHKLDTVIIKQRFCGPPNSGNGGYVSGLLAGYCGAVSSVPGGTTTEVRLMAPPPLDRSLDVFQDDEHSVFLLDGDQTIASAKAGRLELEVPPAMPFAEAQKAAENYVGFRYHPFPQCFVCGPERVHHDGLRIFPGRGKDAGVVAAPWVPDATLVADNGRIAPEYLWAALDCTGAFALDFGPDKVLVLGMFTVEIHKVPQVDEDCVVLGWNMGVDGRKNYAGTAVYNSQGDLCGAGKATWIQLKSS